MSADEKTVPVCDCSPYPNHGLDATPCTCGESCAVQRVPKREYRRDLLDADGLPLPPMLRTNLT